MSSMQPDFIKTEIKRVLTDFEKLSPQEIQVPFFQAADAATSGDRKQPYEIQAKKLAELRVSSDKTKAYLELSQICNHYGLYKEAVSYIDKLLKREPNNTKHLNTKGLYLVKDGQFQEAYKTFQSAARFNQEAERIIERYKLKELAQLEERLEQNPGNAQAYFDMYQILFENGYNPQALQSIDRAIEIVPETSILYLHKGMLLTRMNKRQEALAPFEKALELNPESADGHFLLGKLLLDTDGDLDKARTHFEAAIEYSNDNQQTIDTVQQFLRKINTQATRPRNEGNSQGGAPGMNFD